MDSQGFARTEDWTPGAQISIPQVHIDLSVTAPRHMRLPGACGGRVCPDIGSRGQGLRSERGRDRVALRRPRGCICCRVRSRRRGAQTRERRYRLVRGDRNINYTNVCYFRAFCAFSKGKRSEICADPPTSSISPKSCGARAKRGSAAPPRFAAGGNPSAIYGADLYGCVAAVDAAGAGDLLCTPSRRLKVGTARRPWA